MHNPLPHFEIRKSQRELLTRSRNLPVQHDCDDALCRVYSTRALRTGRRIEGRMDGVTGAVWSDRDRPPR